MKNEFAAVAVVLALVIGAGLGYSGIVGNASTRTERVTTSTTLTTGVTSYQTTTITIPGSSVSNTYPFVTATRITVLVIPVVATCTTVSGTRSITYVYAAGGQTTTVTTIYPSNLPQEFHVTVVTASTVMGSNHTYVQVPDTC